RLAANSNRLAYRAGDAGTLGTRLVLGNPRRDHHLSARGDVGGVPVVRALLLGVRMANLAGGRWLVERRLAHAAARLCRAVARRGRAEHFFLQALDAQTPTTAQHVVAQAHAEHVSGLLVRLSTAASPSRLGKPLGRIP